ncbi:hypothetical protein SPI_02586 [Niveomyces insectorum RCEF 264]|uniref:Uncharacterized protein n=1 Tax=Niveomyces insectorum RCEF 264 TaxID=1081102 RepID=A0A167Y3V3_9HYPO|nr:hypothetical protein SPI_02586 [Niveomyces insectorum RCEF 264]
MQSTAGNIVNYIRSPTPLKATSTTFYEFFADSAEQKAVTKHSTKELKERLSRDPELCEKLIPGWGVGCRPPTPGEGYLVALPVDNVMVYFNGIRLNDQWRDELNAYTIFNGPNSPDSHGGLLAARSCDLTLC